LIINLQLNIGDFLLSSGLKNHIEHRAHREKLHRSVLWYEKVGDLYFFMFIYEPQFIADSVVDYLCSESFFQNAAHDPRINPLIDEATPCHYGGYCRHDGAGIQKEET
jgi:hypothetical protein